MRSVSAQRSASLAMRGNCLPVTLTAVPSIRLFSTDCQSRTVASTASVTGRTRSSAARTLMSPP